jgi:hypothetical protein
MDLLCTGDMLAPSRMLVTLIPSSLSRSNQTPEDQGLENETSTKRQLSRALSAGRCSAEGPENRAVPSIARVATWASLGGAVESLLVIAEAVDIHKLNGPGLNPQMQ